MELRVKHNEIVTRPKNLKPLFLATGDNTNRTPHNLSEKGTEYPEATGSSYEEQGQQQSLGSALFR